MKVKDLIKMGIDIDVYDDVCEELGIAFCGPIELTAKGASEFEDVLDYEVEINNHCCIVLIDQYEDWEFRLGRARKLFYSLAGYCSADDWDAWFKTI